jgi:hypothetical protein
MLALLAIAAAVTAWITLRRAPPLSVLGRLGVAACSAWIVEAVRRYVTSQADESRMIEVFGAATCLFFVTVVSASYVPTPPVPALARARIHRRRSRHLRVIAVSKTSSPRE